MATKTAPKAASTEHTHDYSNIQRDDVTHDHKNGDYPHIHDGLEDKAYVAAVKKRGR